MKIGVTKSGKIAPNAGCRRLDAVLNRNIDEAAAGQVAGRRGRGGRQGGEIVHTLGLIEALLQLVDDGLGRLLVAFQRRDPGLGAGGLRFNQALQRVVGNRIDHRKGPCAVDKCESLLPYFPQMYIPFDFSIKIRKMMQIRKIGLTPAGGSCY